MFRNWFIYTLGIVQGYPQYVLISMPHSNPFALYILVETNGKMSSKYICLWTWSLFLFYHIYKKQIPHINLPYVYAWCVNLHKMLTVMALHQVIWNDNPIIYIYSNLDRSLTIIFIPKQIRKIPPAFPPDFLHAVAPSGLDPALERRRRRRRRPHAARCGWNPFPWLGKSHGNVG